MSKIILLALPLFLLSIILLPQHAFAATMDPFINTSTVVPKISTAKIKDTTPLTPAEAKALTAKLNKEHNEKAFDKRFNAKAKVAAAKHAKQIKKKVVIKKQK